MGSCHFISSKDKQVTAYSGLLKEYMLKYKSNELEQYMEKDKNKYFYKVIANWHNNQSDFVLEYIHLTEKELEKYHCKNSSIYEMEIE